MTCLDGGDWLLFDHQQVEPQSPFPPSTPPGGAEPRESPKFLYFRDDSSEPCQSSSPNEPVRGSSLQALETSYS